MAGATFYDMQPLCYIDDTDFTDYQGIGSDPMYRRYDSIYSIIKKHIEPQYRGLLARPHYEDGCIHWYVERWNEPPIPLDRLSGEERDRYEKIKDETLAHYRRRMEAMNIEERTILTGALRFVSDEFVYCYDGRVTLVAWGMRPDPYRHPVDGSWVKGLKFVEAYSLTFDPGTMGTLRQSTSRVVRRQRGHRIEAADLPEVVAFAGCRFRGWDPSPTGMEVTADTVFTAQYDGTPPAVPCTVTFDGGDTGEIIGGLTSLECESGHVLTPDEIPTVIAAEGYRFTGWTPDVTAPVTTSVTFLAQYETTDALYEFDAGDHGSIAGPAALRLPLGCALAATAIPTVKAARGWTFTGWDASPLGPVSGNRRFTAQYEKRRPWWRRFVWLWWLLAGLLSLLLLLILLHNCRGCSGTAILSPHFGEPLLPDASVEAIGRVEGPDGVEIDDNGCVTGIIDDDGNLPDGIIVAPVRDEQGTEPVIIHNDGAPDVIANRLNVYFEDENADLNRWAHDFKRAYPSDDYRIIGADPNVRMIQIQIPEDRRDRVREELNAKIPGQDFFVVDESIITLRTGQNGTAGTQGTQGTANAGWHLRATHLQEAWSVSRGTNDVVVAIVDDGIDVAHPVFKGRFFKAYNVFTQNRRLSAGSGHGTHVAALAAGSDQYIAKGVAGVAPQCRIMPIQVFDNGICTFSSIASGIMYAIHNGADVVNVSIGPSFPGIDNLPLEEQRKIARTYFKNEERVYRHIIKTANEKNVILVFAAGNDNIMTAILPECRYAGNTVNVAAVGPDFKAARFSNYAEGTNLSAPGVDINSAYPHSTFKMLEGTSMAAPIVAGTIALMRSLKRDVTVSQAVDVIRRTGQDVGNDIPVMVRPDRALAALKSGSIATQPADSTATPDPDPDNIPPVQGDAGTIDEYAAYRKRLEELRRQRENIDRQISDIEKQINNNK